MEIFINNFKTMYKTAESVSPKHPDKICDQISDAILDACLSQDPYSRVAIESMGGHGEITITGETTSNAKLDVPAIIQALVGGENKLRTNIVLQSNQIAQGVDTGGAGDQGIMVGYACNETKELIPLEVKLSRELCQIIFKQFPFDGKTQVTTEGKKIKTVVASFQNARKDDLAFIVNKWLEGKEVVNNLEVFANPAGDWNQGGFEADTGLTGRKLIVDNYGPSIPIGGGAFSGKDSTKVDRSAAYMARRVAVDYLRKTGAKEVYCYLAYSIGVAEPVMAVVHVDGVIQEVHGYDLKPQSIIRQLGLREPKFLETARWGHFGNGFDWEV